MSVVSGFLTAESIGEGVAWTNPNNAKLSDNIYAYCDLSSLLGITSQALRMTRLANTVGILDDDEVYGMIVSMERTIHLNSGVADKSMRILVNGIPSGDIKKVEGIWFSGDTVVTYGASDDPWGLTLTGADVKKISFGVEFIAEDTIPLNGTRPKIDCISMEIFHGPPIAKGTFGQSASPLIRHRRGFIGRNYGRGG